MINWVQALPPGCTLDRAIRGDAADWSLTDHLLRVTANAVITANFQRASKRTPKNATIPEPRTGGPRIADQPRREQKSKGLADLNAMFDAVEGKVDG